MPASLAFLKATGTAASTPLQPRQASTTDAYSWSIILWQSHMGASMIYAPTLMPFGPEVCMPAYALSSQACQHYLRIPAGKASKKAPAKPRKEKASGDQAQGKPAKQPSKLKPKKQQVSRLLRPH